MDPVDLHDDIAAAPRASILIVEDQMVVALGYESVLSHAGHQVCGIAASGPQAVHLASLHRPRLALLDVHLAQGTDGKATAEELMRRFGVASLFVSAHGEVLEETEAGLGCLTKPASESDLLRSVEIVLRRLDEGVVDAPLPPGLVLRPVAPTMGATTRDGQKSRLAEGETRFRAIFENAPLGICLVDPEGILLEANPPVLGLVDPRAGSPLDRPIHEVVPLEGLDLTALVARAFATEDGDTVQLQAVTVPPGAEDELRHFLVSVIAVFGAFHEPRFAIVLMEENTRQRSAEREVRRLALEDPLTRLANRALFFEHVEAAMARAVRASTRMAVMLIDLDRFKEVNDTFGHPAGDRLLQAVAQRIQNVIRRADIAARLGGDEFALVLERVDTAADALEVARKISEAIAQPVELDGHTVQISASIGIALGPDDGVDAEALRRSADLALYRAKAEGRDTARIFGSEMAQAVSTRRLIESDLRRALATGQLGLAYQPQIDPVSGRVKAVETLLRWRLPSGAHLAPVDFLPIAERTGLILDIGSWVVEQVCRTAPRLRFLQTPDAGARPIRLAFNLSPLECRRGVLRHLLHALDETPLEATVIEIEVTEQVLGLPDGEDCTRDLREVRARGGSVAVSGFGGSAACISRALDLQVDKLKLHRSLVAAIGTKPGTRRTLRAMIDLGRSLGFDVVAEGVETGEQRAFLEHVSCPTIQGYLVAPPMQWPELEVWLEQHRTARPSVA